MMKDDCKILLIDDDDDDLMLFTHAVQNISAGITCICINNCEEALEKLQEGLQPDIIFLDLNMPVIHGFDCLSQIKQSGIFGSIPVIIYSTSGYSIDIDKARQLGAAGYLKKPSDFDNLNTKVNNFITHTAAGNKNYIVDI